MPTSPNLTDEQLNEVRKLLETVRKELTDFAKGDAKLLHHARRHVMKKIEYEEFGKKINSGGSMSNSQSLLLKKFSFGGCDFVRTSPKTEDLSSTTKVLNIEVDFAEALKLHLSIGECISKLNKYKRSTKGGKRTALNLAIHLSKNRVTINEATLPATNS